MATEFYTDQILDDNFHRIIDFNNDVLETLGSLTTLAERTETRLHVLEKLSARPVVVKSSKVLILTAMAVSAYAGYKYAENRFKDDFTTLQRLRENEREMAKSRTDHPAGRKINGETQTHTS
jgi:hypothetical protein